jgi:hypothetical protein
MILIKHCNGEERTMTFYLIKRKSGSISLEEWTGVVKSHRALERMPDRKSVNPFTKTEELISGEGKAIFNEANKSRGNFSLEKGCILTTGVPKEFCDEIAAMLNAYVYEDDRS